MRYYRNSLILTKNAVNYWKSLEEKNGIKLKCILQLGDIIDGKAKSKGSDDALNRVLEIFENYFKDQIILHVWGNHEFYNYDRIILANTWLNTAKFLQQNTIDINSNY